VPIPRRAGEDVLRIYVDTDDRDTVGLAIGNMFADRLMEVRGRVGRITARDLFSWNPATRDWQIASGYTLDVAFVGSQFEASIQAGFLGTLNNASVLFAMSDWTGRGDATDASGLRSGTRSSPGIGPLHGTGAATAFANALSSAPAVDGTCSDAVYGEAGIFTDTGIVGYVGTNGGFVYVCVVATLDMTDNGANDFARIYFDRDHDPSGNLSAGDRRFAIASGSGLVTPESRRGNSTGPAWEVCPLDASPSAIECFDGNQAEGAFGASQNYEFKIHYTDVWNTTTPGPNQIAGFAVIVTDAAGPTVWTWGSTEPPADLDPGSWGHLEIPEFPAFAVVAAMVMGLAVVARRRRTRPPTLK
jgi:hypothetical protein